MIIRKNLDEEYLRWNRRWGAPFGYAYNGGCLKRKILSFIHRYPYHRHVRLLFKWTGIFSVQENSATRIYEYPWAYFATDLSPGMHIIEIGGGLSGFQFVLSAMGAHVINIDPMDKKYNWEYTPELFDRMNSLYNTDVRLFASTIDTIGVPDGSIDRIFCISVLEHLRDYDIKVILKRISAFLKPNGYMICTADLFLDLYPFSNRKTNTYGRNISIRNIINQSGLELYGGNKAELYGYESFHPKQILARLDSYYIAESYPVISQAFILKKPKQYHRLR